MNNLPAPSSIESYFHGCDGVSINHNVQESVRSPSLPPERAAVEYGKWLYEPGHAVDMRV